MEPQELEQEDNRKPFREGPYKIPEDEVENYLKLLQPPKNYPMYDKQPPPSFESFIEPNINDVMNFARTFEKKRFNEDANKIKFDVGHGVQLKVSKALIIGTGVLIGLVFCAGMYTHRKYFAAAAEELNGGGGGVLDLE